MGGGRYGVGVRAWVTPGDKGGGGVGMCDSMELTLNTSLFSPP